MNAVSSKVPLTILRGAVEINSTFNAQILKFSSNSLHSYIEINTIPWLCQMIFFSYQCEINQWKLMYIYIHYWWIFWGTLKEEFSIIFSISKTFLLNSIRCSIFRWTDGRVSSNWTKSSTNGEKLIDTALNLKYQFSFFHLSYQSLPAL